MLHHNLSENAYVFRHISYLEPQIKTPEEPEVPWVCMGFLFEDLPILNIENNELLRTAKVL